MPLRARHLMNREKLLAEFPHTASSDNNLQILHLQVLGNTYFLALGRCHGIMAGFVPLMSPYEEYYQMNQTQWKDSHLQVK